MSDTTDDEFEGPRLVYPTPAPAVEYRPLSVSISDETRAQLQLIAKLKHHPLKEETRLAMEHWVEISKNDPDLRKRAEREQNSVEREAARIEREAATKRSAFASFFGGDETVAEPTADDDEELREDGKGPGDLEASTDAESSAGAQSEAEGLEAEEVPSEAESADADEDAGAAPDAQTQSASGRGRGRSTGRKASNDA